MSRSRNDGTPSWAQVLTRPEVKRCSERSLIRDELRDYHLGLEDEAREAALEEEFWNRYLDREEDRPGLDWWHDLMNPLPSYDEPEMDDFYVLDDYLPGDL